MKAGSHERAFENKGAVGIIRSDRMGVDATATAVDPDGSTVGVESSKIATEATEEVRRSALQACACTPPLRLLPDNARSSMDASYPARRCSPLLAAAARRCSPLLDAAR